MSITVYLQDDQDIDQALYLLNQKHYHLQATRWYKKDMAILKNHRP
ncbi:MULTISPECIES: hypothetical protein [Acinetobacter]|jgi:hypothetical protein|nr:MULTISPECIES: hypothetical protein [Acinetobacter]HJP48575.1 hypothetical protein [Acinetobacter venetianus]